MLQGMYFACIHILNVNNDLQDLIVLYPRGGEVKTIVVTTGFTNWKKALERFSEHDSSIHPIHAAQLSAAKGKTDVAKGGA